MRRIPIILLFAIYSSSSFAQEKTFKMEDNSMLEKRGLLGSLVIIPFEDKMYMSDADAPIGRETGLNPGEIMTKFRNSLVESLEIEMQRDWNIQVVRENAMLDENFGLDYIHGSVKYQYVAVPEEVLMANDTTLEKKDLKKNKKSSKGESGVHEGQIVTHSDQTEKYMTLIVNNDTLMSYVDHNLPSDYYLFLNEFDIRHHITDPAKVASGGLKYRLKIHFSCIDKNEKVLVSGAATSVVDAGNKNVYYIIQEGIPELTAKMAKMIRKFKLKEK